MFRQRFAVSLSELICLRGALGLVILSDRFLSALSRRVLERAVPAVVPA